VEHRRTPSHKVFVPPSWFIVLTILLCIGSAGWIGWLLVDRDAGQEATPAVTTTTTPSPSVTTPEPTTTTTTPTPEPTPTSTTAPAVERSASVSVLNNTGISGLARTFAVRVTDAGWTLAGVGNWRGSVPGNTVYYPAGFEAQATQLAHDVGITRVRASVAPMRMDRLTVILAGPQ
jgi:cytoskeletal protein RodZ